MSSSHSLVATIKLKIIKKFCTVVMIFTLFKKEITNTKAAYFSKLYSYEHMMIVYILSGTVVVSHKPQHRSVAQFFLGIGQVCCDQNSWSD
jgi:hypothetical protein